MVTSGKVSSAETQRLPMACAIRMTTAQMANCRIPTFFGRGGQRLKVVWLNGVSRGRPVGVPGVQIDEDIARLCTLAGTNNAALLKFVHDSCRPGVAEPQTTLH